jgi:hypothetical protein
LLSSTGVSDKRKTLPTVAPDLAGILSAHVVIAGKDESYEEEFFDGFHFRGLCRGFPSNPPGSKLR